MFMLCMFFVLLGLAVGGIVVPYADCPKAKVVNFIAGFWSIFGLLPYCGLTMVVMSTLSMGNSAYSLLVFMVVTLSLSSLLFGSIGLLFQVADRIDKNEHKKNN